LGDLVFEEVHRLISSSLKPSFEAVQRRSINVFLYLPACELCSLLLNDGQAAEVQY